MGRLIAAHVAEQVLEQVAEQLVPVFTRLDAIEAELARQRQTMLRFAELHGDAMQRIGDELVEVRRLQRSNRGAE